MHSLASSISTFATTPGSPWRFLSLMNVSVSAESSTIGPLSHMATSRVCAIWCVRGRRPGKTSCRLAICWGNTLCLRGLREEDRSTPLISSELEEVGSWSDCLLAKRSEMLGAGLADDRINEETMLHFTVQ